MKKFNIVLCFILIICTLAGCANTTVSKSANNTEKLNIVTTIYPIYDWTKNIAGDTANIKLLLDDNVDLHNYQPTAQDIIKIQQSDVFVFVGGESDEWVEDVLDTIDNPNLITVNLSDALSGCLKEEELIEGMQASEEEEEGEEGEEEGPEYDEHIWLSVRNAIKCTDAITNALITAVPNNTNLYKTNSANYIKQLEALDKNYEDVVKNANVNTLIFADRFPFRYLVDDYELNYYAAFIGCSAETEASFETISFLANKVDELGLKYIYKIEGRDDNIAKTVSSTSNSAPAILELNSMQSGNITDSYIDIMKSNLNVLEKGLKNE